MDDSLLLSDTPDPSKRDEFEQWLEDRSLDLATLIEVEIQRIVTKAFRAFIDTVDLTTVTASGDLYAIDNIPAEWNLVVSDKVIPHTTQTHMAGSISAYSVASTKADIPASFVASWLPVVNQEAVEYARTAENRLRGVGNTLWNDIRKKVTKSIETGNSNETLKRDLESLGRFSEYRADTIARTETSSAYINGDYAGHQALGRFGPVEKVWVATLDDRTRQSHVAAWQSSLRNPVPFTQPFQVGNTSMMYPHAPNAPAKEVVNCRCYYDALYPGDRRPNGSIVPKPMQAQQGPVRINTTDDRLAFARSQRQRGLSVENFPDAEEAVINYTNGSGWYSDINTSLRSRAYADKLSPSKLAKRDEYVAQLDNLISQAPPLEQSTVTFRGIKNDDFADTVLSLRPGDTVRDAGYMSTSVAESTAQAFARTDGVVLEIINPAGTRGISPIAYRVEPTAELVGRGEMEWLLPRDTSLRVISVEGRRVVAEVVQ